MPSTTTPDTRSIHTEATLPRAYVDRTASPRRLRLIDSAAHALGHLDFAPACPVSDRAIARLTARQCQIMELVAHGLTNAAIASRLNLAEKSVENQLSAIYSEMGVHGGATDASVHPRVTAVLAYLLQVRAGHLGRSAMAA